MVEKGALDEYVNVLAEASDGIGDSPSVLTDRACACQEELAPCDVEPGDRLSLPLDRVPGLSAAVEELIGVCTGKGLSLDDLTLHGVNPPPGCEAEQLYYAAALLCEALESCLGSRRFWWTNVVVSKGAPPASVEMLSSGLKLSFVVGSSDRQGDPRPGATMGQGQAWEFRSGLPALQPSCVVATFLVSDGYSACRFDRLHWLRSVGFRIPPVVSEPQRPAPLDGRRSGSVRRPDGGGCRALRG